MFGKSSENRMCAFCKLPHRVYTKKEVSYFDVIMVLFVTGIMAYAIWEGPDLRSMLIFMGISFVLQVFLRVRYRESVKCPHCGFDPILYHQDSESAAKKVKSFMDQRKGNPEYMLRPQPKIQPIYKTRAEILAQQNQVLPEADLKTQEELPPAEPHGFL